MSLNRLYVIDALGVEVGIVTADGTMRTWDLMFKAWLAQHPELPGYDGPWVITYTDGKFTAVLDPEQGQTRKPFIHKGFTIMPLGNERYQVVTPAGNVLPKICNGKEAVRGFVYDVRNTDAKDRCEHCSSPSKGPLMHRADGYHRVCHECARSKWPQYWAFFRYAGWYPGTQSELESGRIEQDSSEKNWDGSKRAPWMPSKVLVGRAS